MCIRDRGRVAGADGDLGGAEGDAGVAREGGDAKEGGTEIAFDVDGEGFELSLIHI